MTIDATSSPFHAGEIAIQNRYGATARIGAFARKAVRDHLTEQHRDFFALLPTLALGVVDAQGRPWATLLAGAPGFMSSADPQRLRVDALPVAGDPALAALREGAQVGGLGIQFETRRRNRFAARVIARDAAGITLAMDQTFGNCPQYITTRAPLGRVARTAAAPEAMAGLDAEAAAMIAAADTFLVATAAPPSGDLRDGADVSHRGGRPGFVKVAGDVLTIPDFSGNLHFNTFGNLALNPRAGLSFIDFASGDMLLLTGEAAVQFDGPEIAAFAGAERLWRFRVEQGVRLRGALAMAWTGGDASPNSLATGDWAEAEATLAAARLGDAWRPLRVVRVKDESADVRSLWLEPADGAGVSSHAPGQFLPIRLTVPGEAAALMRTYTLSDAQDGRAYRISVKREPQGRASGALHALAPGAIIEAQAPRGGFVLEEGAARPILMISAGIGVTPTLAMLGALFPNPGRARHGAEVVVIHAARDGAADAFGAWLRAKAAAHPRLRAHIAYSRPRAVDGLGENHHSVGRIDRALVQRLLPLDDWDVYLCGPSDFMADVYALLRELGVRDARIRFEAFGPASVTRQPDEGAPARPPLPDAATVTLAGSGTALAWTPAAGTLLELAESAGFSPAHGCRAGACGACATTILDGAVIYDKEPAAPRAEDVALICCARPAGPLTLAL